MKKTVLALLGVLFFTQNPAAQHASPDVRVLLVTGGGFFESSLYIMLGSYKGVDVTTAASDVDAFREDISDKYDVVLLMNRSMQLADGQRENLKAFVESGGGLIAMNQSFANYGDWPWYRQTVGGYYRSGPEGDAPSSVYRLNEPVIAAPLVRDHAVTCRLEGMPFHFVIETYERMWLSSDNQVLVSTRNSTSDGPLVWVSSYDKARVLGITPGYGHGAHLNVAFRHLVEDAIHWVSGRDSDC